MNKKLLSLGVIGVLSTTSAFAGVSDVDQFLTDYEQTPVEQVMPINSEPEVLTDSVMTTMEPVTTQVTTTSLQKSENTLSGEYLGNGVLNVNGVKVKFSSKHLKHLEKGDQVVLTIDGNIKKFTIKSISKNGEILVSKINVDKSSTLESTQEQLNILSGKYLGNNKIDINGKSISIYSKGLETIKAGTQIDLQIEGTINKFKIKKILIK